MTSRRTPFLLLAILFVLAVVTACSQEPVQVTREVEVTREVTVEVEGPGTEMEVEVTRVVEVEVEPETAVDTIPFEEQWVSSAHADVSSEAFNHWNGEDPPEVPVACAKCHSTPGYLSFIGADGSQVGVVDHPVPVGSVVECEACHNDVTRDMDRVIFPSGVEINDLEAEARCMQCHQGRHSTVSVNQSIVDAGLDGEGDLDTVSEDLGFSNIHYYAAAATQLGTEVQGGYEYDGRSYDARFDHVAPYDSCVDCHNAHTLQVQIEECSACHTGVETAEDLADIRMQGSLVDYDGDGDIDESVIAELEGLQEILFSSIQAYASEVAGTPIVYSGHGFPYFFIDTDGDGEVSEEEAVFANRYNAWTPRLAKAVYNYQVSKKDPGDYAHGGKYIIQLLYDSIEDLNQTIADPVDMSAMNRIDRGHFAASEEAFRHWDEDGEVPQNCSKCHTAAGLPLFLEQGVSLNQPPSSGLNCASCHNDLTTYTLFESESVQFPSGATVSLIDVDDKNGLSSNLCLNCHQGRESASSVNAAIGDLGDDEQSDSLRFKNIHYFAAGASLFGSEARGGYEYDGQSYLGRYEHVSDFDTCIECHGTHTLQVDVEQCGACHRGVRTDEDLLNIRETGTDFDGDGDISEGIAGEIETMREKLLVAMQFHTASQDGLDIIAYDSSRYPYWMTEDGEGYSTWTPRLLRAAYNYQFAKKDPGAFAHNGLYVLQLLYDSLRDLEVSPGAMIRP